MCRLPSNLTPLHSTISNEALQILDGNQDTELRFHLGTKCLKHEKGKKVRFQDPIVSLTAEIPTVLPADIPLLFYNQRDFRRFRYEYVALKKALSRRRVKLPESSRQMVPVMNQKETSLLDFVFSYFFDQKQSPSSSRCEISKCTLKSSDKNSHSLINQSNKWITTTSDMRQVWDLEFVSNVF